MPRKNKLKMTSSTNIPSKKNSHSYNPEFKRIIKKEDVLILRKLLDDLESDDHSEPFLVPVDYRSLGLLDYPEIIKRPMDISTVRKKIKNFSYKFLSDVFSDLQLIWDNCMLYNLDESDIYKFAKCMELKTNKLVLEYFQKGEKENTKKKSQSVLPAHASRFTSKKQPNDNKKQKVEFSPTNLSTAEGNSITEESFWENFDIDLRYNQLNIFGLQQLIRIAVCECPDSVQETEDQFKIKSELLNKAAIEKMNKYKNNFIKNRLFEQDHLLRRKEKK